MRNDTRSRLTLVDRNGREIVAGQSEEETAAEYSVASVSEDMPGAKPAQLADRKHQSQFLTFAAVSAGCAAAAVVTGSYALWLSRRRIANEALNSVHDILKTCQDRVSQMEDDLSRRFLSSSPFTS